MELHSAKGGEHTAVVIDEVEAYSGGDDGASHARNGRTTRNATMFLGGGHLYVYRIHQVVCANVVVGPEGSPSAVLLRGGIPIAGADVMAHRRGRRHHLTDGPGKLCQALGITIADDGALLGEASGLWLQAGTPPDRIEAAPRVGISRAVDRPWRFIGAWATEAL